MKILDFILFLWVIFALLDPDPANQINADPDPKPCYILFYFQLDVHLPDDLRQHDLLQLQRQHQRGLSSPPTTTTASHNRERGGAYSTSLGKKRDGQPTALQQPKPCHPTARCRREQQQKQELLEHIVSLRLPTSLLFFNVV
jgi:hypothetical protein